MSGNLFNRLIDFRAGTQEDYDSLLNETGGISEEDLYYVTRDFEYGDRVVPMPNLYIGTDLIGDAYNSQYISTPSKRVTNPIGLITYGMTLGRLISEANGSISKVIDMMLFTDRAPSIDECGIISGFIPSVDVSNEWSNISDIGQWITEYAGDFFNNDHYEMFYNIEGEISTVFNIELDQDKPLEEYGSDVGIYSGRMFIAVPHDTDHETADGLKDISVIVDKVFSRIYAGDSLRHNFTTYDNVPLEFNGISYPYKLYLFGTNQNVISRINMEYSVTVS